jgi:predicted NBD/HSP70 family sugar kinase
VVLVMPGMTDTKLRHIRVSYQLGWRDLPLADHIEAMIGIPVIAHNNTRAMAFAEFRHKHLDADQPMLFVQAKYGVGASMLNGITPSPHGHYGVSELGHLRMGENRFADHVTTDGTLVGVLREPYLRDVLGCRDMQVQIVAEMERRANAKDPVAVGLFDQSVANLALCLAVAINLQNPSIVVLGGIYAGLSDATLDRLLVEIARNVPDELMQPVRLSRTALGPAGAIQGAAIVGFDRLLRQPDTYRAVEAT